MKQIIIIPALFCVFLVTAYNFEEIFKAISFHTLLKKHIALV